MASGVQLQCAGHPVELSTSADGDPVQGPCSAEDGAILDSGIGATGL